MFAFFVAIEHLFQVIVDFIVSVFEMLLTFLELIPFAITCLVDGFVYLPPFLLGFVSLFLVTALVINLINKGG